jgi:hypothetical protein
MVYVAGISTQCVRTHKIEAIHDAPSLSLQATGENSASTITVGDKDKGYNYIDITGASTGGQVTLKDSVGDDRVVVDTKDAKGTITASSVTGETTVSAGSVTVSNGLSGDNLQTYIDITGANEGQVTVGHDDQKQSIIRNDGLWVNGSTAQLNFSGESMFIRDVVTDANGIAVLQNAARVGTDRGIEVYDKDSGDVAVKIDRAGIVQVGDTTNGVTISKSGDITASGDLKIAGSIYADTKVVTTIKSENVQFADRYAVFNSGGSAAGADQNVAESAGQVTVISKDPNPADTSNTAIFNITSTSINGVVISVNATPDVTNFDNKYVQIHSTAESTDEYDGIYLTTTNSTYSNGVVGLNLQKTASAQTPWVQVWSDDKTEVPDVSGSGFELTLTFVEVNVTQYGPEGPKIIRSDGLEGASTGALVTTGSSTPTTYLKTELEPQKYHYVIGNDETLSEYNKTVDGTLITLKYFLLPTKASESAEWKEKMIRITNKSGSSFDLVQFNGEGVPTDTEAAAGFLMTVPSGYSTSVVMISKAEDGGDTVDGYEWINAM